MQTGKDKAGQRQDVTDDFLHWIKVAREFVADHFPAERTEPHNQMVIDTARTLMLGGPAWRRRNDT